MNKNQNAKDRFLSVVCSSTNGLPLGSNVNVIVVVAVVDTEAGAPLIRAYATLGLVKLKEDGPYSDHLKEWIIFCGRLPGFLFHVLTDYKFDNIYFFIAINHNYTYHFFKLISNCL